MATTMHFRGKTPTSLVTISGRAVRHGKTQKDLRSGSWKRRLENQAKRAEKDYSSCKGKGNSSKPFKVKPSRKAS